MSQNRSSPQLDVEVAEALANAAGKIRLPMTVRRIWQRLLTQEERDRVEGDPMIGPDIIDIWAGLRGMSMELAVVDLARRAQILPQIDCDWLATAVGGTDRDHCPRDLPEWDRSVRELRLGGTVVKRIRSISVARNVVAILDALQESGWPRQMDDPLPEGRNQRRLHETVKSLNSNLQRLRFRADGTGAGFTWDYVRPP